MMSLLIIFIPLLFTAVSCGMLSSNLFAEQTFCYLTEEEYFT